MTKKLAFMLAVALGGCAGSSSGRVEYAATVNVRSPELVTVDNDVYVLADADEPVFYTDNSYWLYRSGTWYRSHRYDRGWVVVREPAPRLRRIDQPTAYVRYRARQQEARRVPPQVRREFDQDIAPRPDVPSTVPPHQQPPAQPTAPYQPPPAYPQPPKQDPTRSPSEAPVPHDHDIAPVPDRELPQGERTVPRRLDPPPGHQKKHENHDDKRDGKKDKDHDKHDKQKRDY
jgi:hypothetical protein